MPKHLSSLTGAAGEHYVAYKLSCFGIVAALPRGGVIGVDVLASSPDGSQSVAIQVKTAEWAQRTRGRGAAKVPFLLQFALGHKAAKTQNDNLLFAFVDLRGAQWEEGQPDVYIMTSRFLREYCAPWADQVKWVRLHATIEDMAPFKNNWNPVLAALGLADEATVGTPDASA